MHAASARFARLFVGLLMALPALATAQEEPALNALDRHWSRIESQQRNYLNFAQSERYRPELHPGHAQIERLPDSLRVRVALAEMCAENGLLAYLPLTDLYVERLADDQERALERLIGLQHVYFPIIEPILEEYGLPTELKYFAAAASLLHPTAKADDGRAGLWMLRYNDAKLMGGHLSSFVDERLDPVRSTELAADLLQNLYAVYGDWQITLAAYVCGPRYVNNALRRIGGVKSITALYPHLPEDTRGLLPATIATAYLLNYYPLHGLHAQWTDFAYPPDTLVVQRSMLDFNRLATLGKVELAYFKAINPQYKLGYVPYLPQAMSLRITPRLRQLVNANRDTLFFADAMYQAQKDNAADESTDEASEEAEDNKPQPAPQYKTVMHTVKAGETLGQIAEAYGVYVRSIMSWNGKGSSRINVGERLRILLPPNSPISGQQAIDVSANEPASSEPAPSSEYTTYTVRSGDTLWSIAQRYEGLTVAKLREINNLGRSSRLTVGQKLKVPTSGS